VRSGAGCERISEITEPDVQAMSSLKGEHGPHLRRIQVSVSVPIQSQIGPVPCASRIFLTIGLATLGCHARVGLTGRRHTVSRSTRVPNLEAPARTCSASTEQMHRPGDLGIGQQVLVIYM
jgi:hypothetical protein